jgi:uncharacterized membrane protein YqhA
VKREQALSEVIGFLMIVSLLAILFSMYLLYVVPIQGRDAEISHMKYITQEFIGLKADIDGLILMIKLTSLLLVPLNWEHYHLWDPDP